MKFQEVPRDVSFPALEEQVLERWNRDKVFEASIQQRENAPLYVFYDGPPFATGLPHYGHIMTSYIKDVVPRYFTMRGYYVPRRWGWDCHGLPVEYEVEKDLGIRSRSDILAYGIGAFNDACRNTVLRYSREWETIIGRLGRWVDFGNAYKTMDRAYMESVLWSFKRLHERGLTYEGEKVVPYCMRCQTTLSNFEARLDDAFRPRQDPAITVAFRRKGKPGESFLAWTTTPWTLPSNVALAVGPEIEYVAVEKDGETFWLAAASVGRYKRLEGAEERARVRGKELVGAEYEPLLPYFADTPGAFRILEAGFVETETGTGIVHLAPAFGEDDNAVCTAAGISGPNPVQDDGTFDARVRDFAGQTIFEANPHIARHLKELGHLVQHDTYEHNYPHCWRCDTPLIYRAVKSWFVKVTAIKDTMLRLNQQINWIPSHLRDGRFGMWLENARDWAISRARFWGTPVPVWRCGGCEDVEVMGSIAELEARSGKAVSDLHRPAIDEIELPCGKCGGTMTRIPDVLDCWFESGAMPHSQQHYPFENRQIFEENFPGDFIVEYVAQTRGWFYTLVVLASGLFEKEPFRNVVCHGVLLAEDGRKMSKRLRNYPDPMELVNEYGSDALRVGLLSSAVVRGSDARFSRMAVHDSVRNINLPLWNSLHFFTAYAVIDGFEPTGEIESPSLLDRYLLSETEALREGLEARMEAYDFPGAYKLILDHVTLLSTWYIRLVRRRMWGSGIQGEKRTIYEVLYASLSTLARLIAPFVPFLAESLHQALGGQRSVHLEDWPAPRPAWRNQEISAEMDAVRKVVYLVRKVRESHNIKHRHPLRTVSLAGISEHAVEANREILLEELNVKEIRRLDDVADLVAPVVKLNYALLGRRLRGDVKKVAAAIDAGEYELTDDRTVLRAAGHELRDDDFSFRYESRQEGTGVAVEGTLVVALDLSVDETLIAEGMMRDLNRRLQDLRKAADLNYADRIVVSVVAQGELQETLARDEHRGWLAEQVLATEILDRPLDDALIVREVEVQEEPVTIALRRAR
jgi:isoleucyl-tRNA synthetase